MNDDHKWHYFMMHGFEYLVLGYSPEKHNVLCVCLNNLHPGDRKDLMYIVDSDEGQREAYLVAILARHPYAAGGTWWDYLQQYAFFAEFGALERCGVAPAQIKVFQNKKEKELLEDAIVIHRGNEFSIDQEIIQQNSTPHTTKTENIDDILFGAVLSKEDHEEITIMNQWADSKNWDNDHMTHDSLDNDGEFEFKFDPDILTTVKNKTNQTQEV